MSSLVVSGGERRRSTIDTDEPGVDLATSPVEVDSRDSSADSSRDARGGGRDTRERPVVLDRETEAEAEAGTEDSSESRS